MCVLVRCVCVCGWVGGGHEVVFIIAHVIHEYQEEKEGQKCVQGIYCQISNISRTQSKNLNISRLV